MSSKFKHEDDEPKPKSESEPVNVPTASVPYPTGNPPDPMEEYYKHSPERLPPEEATPEPEAKKRK